MNSDKWMMATGLVSLAIGGLATAQEQHPSLPQTPTSYDTRDAGGTAEGDATIQKEEGKTTKVRFTAVTESRDWKDGNGKVIRARLLAFDAANGEEAHLVRDGKIRLLVDGAKRFSLLPLEKLSTEDRAHIGILATARRKQADLQKAADQKKP